MKNRLKLKKHTVIYLCLFFSSMLLSCHKSGTFKKVDNGNNKDIEIYKYYYEYGSYVYITKFKNCPNVVTTTWIEQQGHNVITKGNILIMENDSINFIKK